jgi:hypothetical protein
MGLSRGVVKKVSGTQRSPLLFDFKFTRTPDAPEQLKKGTWLSGFGHSGIEVVISAGSDIQKQRDGR